MSARVAILLPTYEPTDRFLAIAIQCVQAQTFTDWELIVHDDRSRVSVKAMIEPLLVDQRIRFVRSPHRLGIGGNWNACLGLSDSPYLQFLFQDDLWEPDYLATMVKTLDADSSLGFAACNHQYLNDDGIAEHAYDYVQGERGKLHSGKQKGRMFLYDWISRGLHPNLVGEPPFVMLRRSLVEKVGPFALDLPQGLDTEYWARCMLETDWHWEPRTLGTFRVHAGGASAVNDASGRGLFDRFLILARLQKRLPPDEARRTEQVLRQQFITMARKFTHRLKVQTSAPKKRRSVLPLLRFVVRHPLLLTRVLVGALGKRGRER